MTRKKRTFAVIASGVGWAAAFGITIAEPHVDVIQENPFMFSRLFLLCALGGAVLTLGIWFEHALLPVVEIVFKLGMRAGGRMTRLDKLSGTVRPSSDTDWWWAEPINGHGQQDTPPRGWLRR
ncbi:hypothetical protein ABZ912_19730 [Nonomuraea angiospora]|uniref:hypothetical protein n=1 Tax=Nonomuraea angiospora TaxID=46172 RepID=UPI0033F07217